MMAGDTAVGALGIASIGERTFTDDETNELLAIAAMLARSLK
jgi:hypothetical protein